MAKIKLTKEEKSWSFYDLSSSAFTMLLVGIIPVYLKSIGAGVGVTGAQSTAHWGYINSVATLLLAFLAPFIGALADFKGNKKKIFNIFFVISMICIALMIFADNYYVLLAINFIGLIGYTGTYVIYDAFLVDVTTDDRMDYVSSFGYAAGYIGGSIPFLISILFIMFEPFGMSSIQAIKISFFINALWWGLFTIPMLRNVHQKYYVERERKGLFAASTKSIVSTFKKIVKNRNMALFLLSYFFYIDGVNTIVAMSTEFGADVGIDTTQMIIALLCTQFIAAAFVMICANLIKRFSAKLIIMVSIVIFAIVCALAFFMSQAWHFWLIATVIALVLGTIQAISRSFFAQLITDKTHNNEYFGFYNILGRYSSVLGPLLVAMLTTIFGHSRYGALGISVLFILGFIVFVFIPKDAVKQGLDAAKAESYSN